MKELIRSRVIRIIYIHIIKPIFFQIDPETIHDFIVKRGSSSNKLTLKLFSLLFSYKHKKLEQTILGINFKNPIGLAAGFDKDAKLTNFISSLGFGFMEVGSITYNPYEGNPGRRLWRFPNSKSLLVYYGLKNQGAKIISERLKTKTHNIIVGTSIAKTNSKYTVETKEGIRDYIEGYKYFKDVGDYFTINISCPNAFGGEPFTDPIKLNLLLKEIVKVKTLKPIFLKISPDINQETLDKIIELCLKYKINGIICSNLTKNRNNPKIKVLNAPNVGGFSGKLVEDLSNKQIRYIYKKTKGELVIIGCGGIFTAEDAYKKIRAGASLLQLITGMIYQGPQTVSEINQGLVKLLEKDGYDHINEAIGKSEQSIKS